MSFKFQKQLSNMNYFILLVLMYACASAVHPDEQNSKRAKRIIEGYEFTSRQVHHYKAVEYFVWIGKTWVCPMVVAFWNIWGYAPPDIGTRRYLFTNDSGHQPDCIEHSRRFICGGTLLSPRIVHSACHCFSQPIVRDDTYLLNRKSFDERLENNLQIYMGSIYTGDMLYPIAVHEVHIHESCSVLSVPPHYISYDFAWLYLDEEVPSGEGVIGGTWGKKLDFAGPYKLRDVRTFYDKVLGEMHVCLIVGFGSDREGSLDVSRRENMRHGYVQIMNWFQCFHIMYQSLELFHAREDVKRNFYEQFHDINSDICAAVMPKFKHYVGDGDSGSPVTCNGVYVALVSMTVLLGRGIRGVDLYDLYAAIKHDPLSVTVESRIIFEEILHHRGVQQSVRNIARILREIGGILSGLYVLNPEGGILPYRKRIAEVPLIRNISSYALNRAAHSRSSSTQFILIITLAIPSTILSSKIRVL